MLNAAAATNPSENLSSNSASDTHPAVQIPRRQRHTKIIATIGPASRSLEMIRKLFHQGVDVFRMNFSHGSQDDHAETLRNIRTVESETGCPIAAFADLQGPKLRVGAFKDGKIALHQGMRLRFDLDKTLGDTTRVCLPHPEIISVTKVGDELLFDDGRIRMKTVEAGDGYLVAEVISGSSLSDRKGLNVPGTVLPISVLTPKDRKDLEFALSIGVDWIALSFVQTPEDIDEARELIKGRAPIIVKLEKPSALEHLDSIIAKTDAIMIARGDLGVEIPAENVPSIQKTIIRKMRAAGKPVIVATQMLESMVNTPRPTRAEASDVATAVYDGADAVMLSAETAAGEYPLESVEMMDKITRRTQNDPAYRTMLEQAQAITHTTTEDAITLAAKEVAETVGAKVIAAFTSSGTTALRAARERPRVPVLAITSCLKVARQLTLSYACHVVHIDAVSNTEDMIAKATTVAISHGLVKQGDRMVILSGEPFGIPGNTNVLRIIWA